MEAFRLRYIIQRHLLVFKITYRINVSGIYIAIYKELTFETTLTKNKYCFFLKNITADMLTVPGVARHNRSRSDIVGSLKMADNAGKLITN